MVFPIIDFRQNHWSAERTAKVVEIDMRLEKWAPTGISPRKRISRAERGVTIEFVDIAVDPVGSGLQYRIENRAAGPAPLGRQPVVDDIEFLDGILRGDHHGIFGSQRRVQTAVQIPRVSPSLAAVGAYRGTDQVERAGNPPNWLLNPKTDPEGPNDWVIPGTS